MGTHQAIEYLCQMGHTDIGYLKSEVRISSFLEREQGYQKACEKFGLQFNPDYVFEIPYTEEESYQSFKQILENNVILPTAFITDDDTLSLGVTKALTEKGVAIPGEISIVGYNDRPNCEISSPKLTTIAVPKQAFAFEAVCCTECLINRKFSRHRFLCMYRNLCYRQETCCKHKEYQMLFNLSGLLDHLHLLPAFSFSS